ncbi:histidine phosphatase family protein [Anaerolineales bacterium]
MKRILFVRPGETTWNRLGRQQGWVAIPLNEQGKKQAQRLARFMRNLGVNKIYSSDLHRAQETADIIGQFLGLEVHYDARLRERHVGEWQGLTIEEIKLWYPEDYEEFVKTVRVFQIPSGESQDQLFDRISSFFKEYINEPSNDTIVIVTHSIVIRQVIRRLIPEFPQEQIINLLNMGVTTLKLDEDKWSLVAVNDISHLDGMDSYGVFEPEENR